MTTAPDAAQQQSAVGGDPVPDGSASVTPAGDLAPVLPAAPEEYALGLPEDFRLPEGMQFQADPNNPMVKAVQAFAFEHKLPPAALQGLVKAQVEGQLEELAAAHQAIQEAHSRLGETGAARISAVGSWLNANLPADQAGTLSDMIHSGVGDKVLAALETLISGRNTVLPSGDWTDTRPGRAPDAAELLYDGERR